MNFRNQLLDKVKKLNKNVQFSLLLVFFFIVTGAIAVTQILNNSNFDLRQQAMVDPGGAGGLYAPTSTPTPTKLANGQFCQNHSQCQSNYCADNFCQPITNQPTATPTKYANGHLCQTNTQCASNFCQDGFCQPASNTPGRLNSCSLSESCSNINGCYCPSTCVKSFAHQNTSCGGNKLTPTPTVGTGGVNPSPTPVCQTQSQCQKFGDTCVNVNGCWEIKRNCYAIYSCTVEKYDCLCGIGSSPVNNQCDQAQFSTLTACKNEADIRRRNFESMNGARVCEPGEKMCGNDKKVFTCNEDYADWDVTECGSGQICRDAQCLTSLSTCDTPCFSTSGCGCPSTCNSTAVYSYGSTCRGIKVSPFPTKTQTPSPQPTSTPPVQVAYSTATECSAYNGNIFGCSQNGCVYNYDTHTCGATYGKSSSATCSVNSSGLCAGAAIGTPCNTRNNSSNTTDGLCARNAFADTGDETCVCEANASRVNVEVSGGNTCPAGAWCICKDSGSFISSGDYCPRAINDGETCPADAPYPGCWCKAFPGRAVGSGERCFVREEDVVKFGAELVGLPVAGYYAAPLLANPFTQSALTAYGAYETATQLTNASTCDLLGLGGCEKYYASAALAGVGTGLGTIGSGLNLELDIATNFLGGKINNAYSAISNFFKGPTSVSTVDTTVAYGTLGQRGLNNLGIAPGLQATDDSITLLSDTPIVLNIDRNAPNLKAMINEGVDRMNNPMGAYENALNPLQRGQLYMQEAFPEFQGIEEARDAIYQYNRATQSLEANLDEFCRLNTGVCFEQSQVLTEIYREAGYNARPVDVLHGSPEYMATLDTANHSVVAVFGNETLIVDPRYNFIGNELEALQFYKENFGGAQLLGFSR